MSFFWFCISSVLMQIRSCNYLIGPEAKLIYTINLNLILNEINLVHIIYQITRSWHRFNYRKIYIFSSNYIAVCTLPVACTWPTCPKVSMLFRDIFVMTQSSASRPFDFVNNFVFNKSDQSSSFIQEATQILSLVRHSCGHRCLIVRARMRRQSAPTTFCRELCKNPEM